mmetsp:Transcript_2318/g.6403  ORF Transcript_2318/g.6403 Transcript_2318/m.6403 type:complete len:82 (-) Transcript_2318:173-418(-)
MPNKRLAMHPNTPRHSASTPVYDHEGTIAPGLHASRRSRSYFDSLIVLVRYEYKEASLHNFHTFLYSTLPANQKQEYTNNQ